MKKFIFFVNLDKMLVLKIYRVENFLVFCVSNYECLIINEIEF